jgi:poly-beta-1,6-N-acetyl-D-glucosamine synthase
MDLQRLLPSYVLITPAHNEAAFIEKTIQSMIRQTVLPLKWVIVDDGSTDNTAEIVKRYLADHPWMELLQRPQRQDRTFAGKAYAVKEACDRLAKLPYQVVGNVDADTSFDADHFESLVAKFAEDSRLGIVGAPFREGTQGYDYRFSNIENVWGGCQLFRRECFQDIGGYVPLKGGSIDHIAVVSARMKGWKTRTFTEKVCIHHREMGTAERGVLAAKFRAGVKDYSVGNHPFWELFRILYQMGQRPFVFGGLALGWGYAWSLARQEKRPVSKDLVGFTRREQMQRLARFLFGRTNAVSRIVVPTLSSGKSRGEV